MSREYTAIYERGLQKVSPVPEIKAHERIAHPIISRKAA